MMRVNNHRHSGFTIVELMIATAVLSIVLLMATVVMTNIGRLYYKGINQSRVQGAARSVSDEVAQKLQLNSTAVQHYDPSVVPPPVPVNLDLNMKAYCIDSTRYSYVEGVKIGTKKESTGPVYQHVLWRDVITPGSECRPLDLKSDNPGGDEGQELISPSSRLTEFSIVGPTAGGAIASPYSVVVGVAYGDDDLLSDRMSKNPTCMSGIGGQFCATARLSTHVVQRVSN